MAKYQVFDLWGNSASEVYAVASSSYSKESALYKYDGREWTVIVRGDRYPNDEKLRGPFYTVWTNRNNSVYIAGNRTYFNFGNQWEYVDLYISKFDIQIKGNGK